MTATLDQTVEAVAGFAPGPGGDGDEIGPSSKAKGWRQHRCLNSSVDKSKANAR